MSATLLGYLFSTVFKIYIFYLSGQFINVTYPLICNSYMQFWFICTGEWTLMDTETDLAVINRFDVNEVDTVHYKWGPGNITLELWSKERPVSKDTPLEINHEYELVDGQNYN